LSDLKNESQVNSDFSHKDKYRFIFDKISDLVILCGADYTILESNRSADVIFGQGESLVGKKCHSVLHQKGMPCIDCPLHDTLKSGLIIPLVKYDERFGEYFEERTHPILDEDDHLQSFIITSKNVTKSRELEEKSAQAKKLLALGQISSGVAHDFNNVLTVVLGRIQLLKRQITDEYILNSLKMIEKSALDGASKVRKIQEFSRPSEGALTETIDLKKIIEEVVEITRPKWETASKLKGTLIEPILELEDKIFVLGDSSDIRNAFTNIIFNAVDAMPEGGVLYIKTETDNQNVSIKFKDTGIGMTPETVEKVFDPFFSTKGVMGTGLGMSEVYGIIKRHNGRIGIQSEVGKGTMILLHLPKVAAAKIGAPVIEIGKTAPARILVIDDEEHILEIFKDLLSELGHEVDTNSSSVAALDLFRKKRHDIVITDLGMPVMTGIEISKKIKEIRRETQIIMVSGWALSLDEKSVSKCIDFVINKPFSIEKIIYTISEAAAVIQKQKTG